MRVRKIAVVVGLIGCLPALVQCGAGGVDSSGGAGVVRYGSYQPTSLDPRKSGHLDAVFLTPVFDSLIHRTPSGEIEPRLATEWQFSSDKLSFDLTLRDGVEFQDGEIFNAEAVKANIDAARAPGAARAAELDAIESVEVVDDLHVRVHLSRPATQLVGVFAGEAGMMISPEALDDPDLATNPVGAGPYQLTNYSQGQLEYTAWDGYWNRDAVKNDKVIFTVNEDSNTQFRALKSGQLDIYTIPGALVEAAEEAGLEVDTGKSANLWQLILNTTTPELSKPEVRKAISLAVDRQEVVDSAFDGLCTATAQPFVEGVIGHVEELDEGAGEPHLAEAKKLLAEAGYPDGFDIELSSSTSSIQQDINTLLQAQLKKVGITVEINAIDQAQITVDKRKGQFEITQSVEPVGRPDPTSYVEIYYAEDGVYNQGFSLDGLDDSLLKAQSVEEESARQKALSDLVQDVYEAGAPTVPLCNSGIAFAHHENVKGAELPRFNDYDWSTVYVE